jgi:hypothetical protein
LSRKTCKAFVLDRWVRIKPMSNQCPSLKWAMGIVFAHAAVCDRGEASECISNAVLRSGPAVT